MAWPSPNQPRAVLKAALAGRGLTYSAAAELLGVHEMYVCFIVTGRRRPSRNLARRFAELVGLHVADVFPEIVEQVRKDAAQLGIMIAPQSTVINRWPVR